VTSIPTNNPNLSDITQFQSSTIFSGIDDIPSRFIDVMSRYAYGLQLSTFFTVHFTVPEFLTDENVRDIGHNIIGTTAKNIKQNLVNNQVFADLGCLFCKSVSLPGFGFNTTGAQLNYRDFKGVPVSDSIRYDNRFSMTFYDTHASFADFVLRPWIALISHYGLIARDPNSTNGNLINGLKLPVTITQFSRTGSVVNADTSISSGNIQVNKQIVLLNSCPIDLNNGLELTHSSQGELIMRRCDWVYQDYAITIPG